MGGLRAAGQLIAYELPLVLAVLGVVIRPARSTCRGSSRPSATGRSSASGGITAAPTSSPSSSASPSS
ncbi:MAG: hypothetical protein R2749_02465 [Acidimicrobiales bacterium]